MLCNICNIEFKNIRSLSTHVRRVHCLSTKVYYDSFLKTIDEEYISLELNTNVSPCILKPYDDDSYTYLLLPVRI